MIKSVNLTLLFTGFAIVSIASEGSDFTAIFQEPSNSPAYLASEETCQSAIEPHAQTLTKTLGALRNECASEQAKKTIQAFIDQIVREVQHQGTSQRSFDPAKSQAVKNWANKLFEVGERIQNARSYCFTLDFMRPTYGSNVSLRDLSHLSGGDVFVGGTGTTDLEGNAPFTTIFHQKLVVTLLRHLWAKAADSFVDNHETFRSACQSFIPAEQQPSTFSQLTKADFDTLEDSLQRAFDLTAWLGRSPETFQVVLAKHLDDPKLKGPVFFGGGWFMHAIYYWIKKIDDNNYTFRVYNLGEGISGAHYFSTAGVQPQYLPFIEIENITRKDLFSPVFLKALHDSVVSRESGPGWIYNNLLHELGGHTSTQKYVEHEFKNPQRSGTCSYYSVPSAMESILGNYSAVEPFLFLTQLKILDAFYQQNAQALHKTYYLQNLLKKTVVFFSISTADWLDRRIIDEGMARAAKQHVALISKALEVAKDRYEAENQADAEIKPLHQGAFLAGQFPFPETRTKEEERVSEETYEVLTKPSAAFKGMPIPDPNTINFRPETLSSNLKTVVDELVSKRKSGAQADALLVMIDKAVRAIPLSDEAFWKKVDRATANQILTDLNTLSHEHFFALETWMQANPAFSGMLSPEDYLVQVKILSIVDKIIHRFLTDLKLPSLIQEAFKKYLFGQTAPFTFSSPAWQQELVELRAYWQPFLGESSFFSLETDPAASMEANQRNIALNDSDIKEIALAEDTPVPTRYSDWPDLAWVKSWINLHSTEIYARYPSFASRPDSEQVMSAAYNDLTNHRSVDILPKAFFIARDISFLIDALDTTSLDIRFLGKFQSAKHGGMRLFFDYQHWGTLKTGKTYLKTLLGFNSSNDYSSRSFPSDSNESKRVIDKRGEKDKPAIVIRADHFNRFIQRSGYFHFDMRTVFMGVGPTYYERTRRNDEVIFGKPSSDYDRHYTTKYGAESVRSLHRLSTNPHLQLMETVSFFKSKPQFFQDPEARDLFDRLLFEPPLLTQLSKNKVMFEKFLGLSGALFKSNYAHFLKADQLDLALYFLRENQKLSNYASGSTKLMDSRSELKKFVMNQKGYLAKDPDLAMKALVHLALTYASQKVFSNDDTAHLLSAVVQAKATNPGAKVGPEDLREFNLLLPRLYGNIASAFADEGRANIILNQMLKNLGADAESFRWANDKKKTPSLFSSHGYEIDVLSGNYKTPVGATSLLPKAMIEKANYKEIFGDFVPLIVDAVGEDAYEFTDEGGLKWRIAATKTNPDGLIIQRPIGGQWYQKFSTHWKQQGAAIFPFADIEHQWWLSQDNETGFITSKDGRDIHYSFRVKNRYALKTRYVNGLGQLHFERVVDFVLICKATRDGAPTDICLQDAKQNSSALKRLTDVEHERWVLVFVDKSQNNKLMSVELPRLGLSFTAKMDLGITVLESDQYPGFRLSSSQFIFGLKSLSHYLVLEEAKNPANKIALVIKENLKQPSEQLFGIALQVKSILNQPSKESPLSGYAELQNLPDAILGSSQKIPLLKYALSRDGDLICSGAESCLYLGFLYLWVQEYASALTSIQNVSGNLQAFSDAEREVIKYFIDYSKKDNDPRAVAIRTNVIAKSLVNAQAFGDVEKLFPDKSQIAGLYSEYVKLLDKFSPAYRLDEYQEQSIIRALKNDVLAWKSIPAQTQKRIEDIRIATVTSSQGIVAGASGEAINCRTFRWPGFYDLYYALSEGWRQSPIQFFDSNKLTAGFFWDAYDALLKGPSSKVTFRRLLSQISDVSIPQSFSEHEVYNEFLKTLRLIVRSTWDPNGGSNQSSMACVLLSVASSPDKSGFADKKTFEQAMKDATNASNIPEQLKDTFELVAKFANQKDEHARGYSPAVTHSKEAQPTIVVQAKESFELAKEKTNGLFAGPLYDSVDGFFAQNTISPARSQKLKEDLATLQAKLMRTGNFTYAGLDKYLELEIAKLHAFTENILEKETEFSSPNWSAIKNLGTSLEGQITESTNSNAQRKQTIERLLHKESGSTKENLQNWLKKEGELKTDVGLSDVIYCFLTRQSSCYLSLNSHLDQNEILLINNHIYAYMLESSWIVHLKAVQSAAQDLVDKGNSVTSEDMAALATLLTRKREYDPYEHPEYLVFEYYMGMPPWNQYVWLRKDQVENLERLQIRSGKTNSVKDFGVVIEAIMGSGKTFALLPLLTTLDVQKNHLTLVVFPESLLPSMAKQMETQIGKAFKRSVQVVPVERSSHIMGYKIAILRETIERALKEKRVVVMSSNSIQSLFLRFIEALKLRENEVIQNLREIFYIFKTETSVTIDEVDLALDVLKAHQFATGEKVHLEPDLVASVMSLYRLLVEEKDQLGGVTLPFLSGHRGRSSFSPKAYREQLQPRLIQLLLSGNHLPNMPKIERTIQQLTVDDKKIIEDYLSGSSSRDVESYLHNITNISLKNVLHVWQEELTQVLPLTLGKKLYVHYGPNRELKEKGWNPATRDRYVAIPYHMGQPAIGSRFGTDLETMNYTLQMHLELGANTAMVSDEVKRLRDLYSKYQRQPYMQQRIRAEFDALSNGIAHVSLFQTTQADIEEMTKNAQEDSARTFQLLHTHVLSQLWDYKTILFTNAQIYSILFDLVQGFSGTLWNLEAFPTIFGKSFLSDTGERTLMLLWQNSPKEVPVVLATLSVSELVSQILGPYNPMRSITDMAGVFRGVHNADVAKEMLSVASSKMPPATKGILYYDEAGQVRVGDVLEENSEIPVNDRAAYWDQSHVTGSDLKLPKTMRSMVSVGRHNFIRDFMQAVWRLRLLGPQKQSAQAFVTQEDEEAIANWIFEVTRMQPRVLDLGDLLFYLHANQFVLQQQLNVRAFRYRLRAKIIERVFHKLLDRHSSVEDLYPIFDQTQGLFASFRSPHPYERYGLLKTQADRDTFIANELRSLFNSPSMKAFDSSQGALQDEIRQIANSERSKLPNTIETSLGYGNELQIEVETETETQTQTQVETEVENQASQNEKTRNYQAWTKENLLSSDQFALTSHPGRPDLITLPHMATSDCIQNGPLKSFLKNMSDHIMASSNVIDLSEQCSHFDGLFTPPAKFVSDVLLILDRKTNNLRVMLVSMDEAGFFQNTFEEMNQHQYTGPHDLKLALYNLDSGLTPYLSSDDGITEQEIHDHPEFVNLLVQTKFFNGEIFYTDIELAALKSWLSKQDVKLMRDVFVSQVLGSRSFTKAQFEGSNLYQLFELLLE